MGISTFNYILIRDIDSFEREFKKNYYNMVKSRVGLTSFSLCSVARLNYQSDFLGLGMVKEGTKCGENQVCKKEIIKVK